VEKLREETIALARKLEAKSPAAVRYTKESIRAVRNMSKDEAFDYLAAKSDALKYADPEGGRKKAMSQFLDEKSFKPGLGDFKR
jgi:trans-feruloyl-CoA hydratase/vanillin synthase